MRIGQRIKYIKEDNATFKKGKYYHISGIHKCPCPHQEFLISLHELDNDHDYTVCSDPNCKVHYKGKYYNPNIFETTDNLFKHIKTI